MDSGTLGTRDFWSVGAYKRPGAWGRRLFISVAVFAVAAVAGCGSVHATGADSASKVITATVPAWATAGPSASPSRTHHKPAPHQTAAKPTSTTAIPSPTSSTTQNAAGACVTTAAKGLCGPYVYSAITNSTGQNTCVGQDVWSPVAGWSEDTDRNQPGQLVRDRQHARREHGRGVLPELRASSTTTRTRWPLLRRSTVVSENMNAVSGTSAGAAYDMWLNNWQNEVMIQHDYRRPRDMRRAGHGRLRRLGGVPTRVAPVQVRFGADMAAFRSQRAVRQRGHPRHANWLVNNGYLPQKSRLTAMSYGFEICSTGGKPETFTVSNSRSAPHRLHGRDYRVSVSPTGCSYETCRVT